MAKLYILDSPEGNRSFEMEKDTIHIGRSPDNDIQIKDSSISRRHLKIQRRSNKYFVEDLQSKNGTFVNGAQIESGVQLEVQEGVPIIIGMTLICLGKGCSEDLNVYLDMIRLSRELEGDEGISIPDRPILTKENIELINRVSDILMQSLSLNEIFEKVLDNIFNLLKRIDRGVIILIDNDTGEFTKVIYRLRRPGDDESTVYSRPIVDQVIREGKAIIMSDSLGEEGADLSETLRLYKIKSVMCVPQIGRAYV